MLAAQLSATLTNIAYRETSYAGYGAIIDGEWVSIDDALAYAQSLVAQWRAGVPIDRYEAEFYKDLCDGLNNNDYAVTPYDPCQLPF